MDCPERKLQRDWYSWWNRKGGVLKDPEQPEDALEPVRSLLGVDDVAAAASAWDGRCVVRLMARDAWPLRRVLVRLLTHFRGTVPPRVWQI